MTNTSHAKHSVSGLFVFLLLGLFALFSTVMVLLGARAYKNITQKQAVHNAERIAPAYLRSMIRAADESGIFRISSLNEEADMLVIEQIYDDEPVTTYVYCHDGILRERFITADIEFIPEDGEEVCALDGLRFEKRGGLMYVQMFSKGQMTDMNVALYSAL